MSKWVGDCCLAPICQPYHGGNKLILKWWWGPLCTSVTVLAYWSNIRGQTYCPTRTHYSDYELTPLCCVLSGKATNINFIVLTRWRLEDTIYLTREENSNHYTNDAVCNIMDSACNHIFSNVRRHIFQDFKFWTHSNLR